MDGGALAELSSWAKDSKRSSAAARPPSAAPVPAASATTTPTFEINWFARNWKSVSSGPPSAATCRKAWAYFTDPVRSHALPPNPEAPLEERRLVARDVQRLCLEFFRAVPEMQSLRKDMPRAAYDEAVQDVARRAAERLADRWADGRWPTFRAHFAEVTSAAAPPPDEDAAEPVSVDRLSAPPGFVSSQNPVTEARRSLEAAAAKYSAGAFFAAHVEAEERAQRALLDAPPLARSRADLDQLRALVEPASASLRQLDLPARVWRDVCRHLQPRDARAGERLEPGRMYVVLSGGPLVASVADEHYSGERAVSVLAKGDAFGHADGAAACPCSVRAQAPARLAYLDARGYAASVLRYQREELKRRVALLRRQDAFAAAPEESLRRLAETMQRRRAARGEVVAQQGEEASAVFFVVRGRVRVVREMPPGGVYFEINEAGPQCMFGAAGAVLERPRPASAIVSGPAPADLLVVRRLDLVRALDKRTFRGLARRLAEAHPSDAQLRALLARDDGWERYKRELARLAGSPDLPAFPLLAGEE